jgi:hypothetical protein
MDIQAIRKLLGLDQTDPLQQTLNREQGGQQNVNQTAAYVKQLQDKYAQEQAQSQQVQQQRSPYTQGIGDMVQSQVPDGFRLHDKDGNIVGVYQNGQLMPIAQSGLYAKGK